MAEEKAVVITSSRHEYDMSTWGVEKSHELLEAVSRLNDFVRNHRGLQHEDRVQALDWLNEAIHQGTKLLSFFSGVDWDWHRAKVVFKGGFEAYEELALEYSVITESTAQRRQRERSEYLDEVAQHLAEFVVELLPLLDGERSPNRTLIHELLLKDKINDPTFRLIEDLTESVTMGDLSWDQYTGTVRELIRRHAPINT